MEEENIELPDTMPFMKMLVIVWLLAMVGWHASATGPTIALPLLCVGIVYVALSNLYLQWKVIKQDMVIAILALSNDDEMLKALYVINPFNKGMLTDLIAKGIVAAYLVYIGVDYYIFAALVIAPNIMSFYIFSRLSNLFASDAMRDIAISRMEADEKTRVTNKIFQEEVDKILPSVKLEADKRLKELYPEDYQDEQPSEPSDSDNKTE